MDISEQQEISKSRPQVKTKLNKWCNWLISHVPKPIKDAESKAFKTFKDKVMRLYNRVTGSTGELKNPNHLNQWSLSKLSEGLTGPIGLMENQRWMLIRSLVE